MSSITYAVNTTSPSISAAAAETTPSAADDDITVNHGVTVTATTGDVTFDAGDDVTINGTVQAVAAGKSVSIRAGVGDNDGLGAILIAGTISATNIALTAPGDITLPGATLTAANDITISSGGTITYSAATATQVLTTNGGPGSFTLTFNGQTTAALASSGTTAAQVQAALNGLSSIGGVGGSVTVTQFNNTYSITFGGSLAFNPPLLAAVGTGSTVAVAPAGPTTMSGHDVTLVADQMALDTGAIMATDAIILAPLTAGNAVSLGDGFAASGLAISSSELGTLTAPTLTIGEHAGTTTAGPIQVGQANFTSSTLNLFSTGGVTQSNGLFTVGGGSGTLNVTAGGTVHLGALLPPVSPTLDVGTVGGSTTSGDFVIQEAGPVPGPVTVTGIATAGGEIVVDTFSGDLGVDGPLTSHGGNILAGSEAARLILDADIDAGAGAIGLRGRNPSVLETGGINQTGGKLVGGDLVAIAVSGFDSDVTLTGASNAISGHVVLQADRNISFTDTLGYTIGGITGITYGSTGETLSVNGPAISAPGLGSVTLTAGGDIGQASGVLDYVDARTLNLGRLGAANPNVTLDNPHNIIFALGPVDLGTGTLTLADQASLSTDSISAGTTSLTTFGLTINGAITTGALTLTSIGSDIDVKHDLTGIGSLETFGSGILFDFNVGAVTTSGAQTYHGAVLSDGQALALTSTGSGTITIADLQTSGDLTINTAGTTDLGGSFFASGRLFQEGSGTTTIASTLFHTGNIFVDAGKLLIDGNTAFTDQINVAAGATLGGDGTIGQIHVASDGTLAPGDSPGILKADTITLAAGAHLAIELGGATPGLYDQLQVNGNVDLAGATLDLALVNGFAPTAVGETFTIIHSGVLQTGNLTGTFAGLADGAVVAADGAAFTIHYSSTDVTLTALADEAPVNTVPGTQSVLSDTDLAIGGISIADADAAADAMTTTLSVTHGILHAASGHATVAGDGSGSVTLSGSQADIDATLASLTYHSAAGFSGTDTLNVFTSDLGHNGVGGPLTDTDTVKINVTAPPQQGPQPIIGTNGDDTFTAPAGDSDFIGLRGVDTIVFNFALVDARVTYSGNDIIIDGPNGISHTVTTGFETYVFTDGTVNDRDGSPLIDDLFYYSRNHDVWTAHVDADTHYNTLGWKEGRDPNNWFDTKGYLAHYTDVAAAGLNPLAHYDQDGWLEGRDPSTAFDTKAYLAHYPDVAALHYDPLAHFLTWQGEEARQPFGDGVWG